MSKKIISFIIAVLTACSITTPTFAKTNEEDVVNICPEGEHQYVLFDKKEPSCDDEGYEKYECKVCKVEYCKIIQPTGHDNVTTSKKATYFESGYENRIICIKCRKIFDKGTKTAKLKLKTPKIKKIKSKSIKCIELKWGKVKDATGYYILRKKSSADKYKEIKKVKNKTSFCDKTADIGYKWLYKIKAFIENKDKKEAKSDNSSKKSILHMPLYSKNDGFEESPIGATGWLQDGTIFEITKYNETKFKIKYKKDKKEKTKWVKKDETLINLPQVIPSITYDIYNCYESRYPVLISEYVVNIPDISNQNLYGGKKAKTKTEYKGEKEEWIVPCYYNTAKRLVKSQKEALLKGDCIKVIDTYRSVDRTRKTFEIINNSYYAKFINPKITDFLSKDHSQHNKGIAVDCSLIKRSTGREYKMQTEYNLMTPKTFRKHNNNNAKKLEKYMKSCGFTPLSTEWYHFTDANSKNKTVYMNWKYPTKLYK